MLKKKKMETINLWRNRCSPTRYAKFAASIELLQNKKQNAETIKGWNMKQ